MKKIKINLKRTAILTAIIFCVECVSFSIFIVTKAVIENYQYLR